MKSIEVPVANIHVTDAIATRKGGHDKDSIERIAKSFMYRADAGIEPVQIMPIVVRPLEGEEDQYELIDGRGRVEAITLVNDTLGGIDGSPMLVRCTVVRGDDQQALVSGLQANFHDAIDAFDQADVAQKLIDTGMKQKDVAKVLNVTEGRISQILPLNKCAKKYVQAYRDGDLEQDAVIAIANMDADDNQRQEIFEEAVRHREKLTTILARREHKQKKSEIEAEIERTKALTAELAEKAKAAVKAQREADKLLAAAKDEKEVKKLRKVKEEADKEAKTVGKAWAEADRSFVKAKEAKEKLAANPPVKKARATKEDVQEAAKAKGAKGTEDAKVPKSKQRLIAEMEAMEDMPKSANDLMGKIEGFLDGDYTAAQLRNSFLKNCVPDK